MSIALEILCWLCLAGLLHTYLFYPWLLGWLARSKEASHPIVPEGKWPIVSVLMSLYNEEQVIEKKLGSLLELDYPTDRLEIFIGSDASSDRTNILMTAAAAANSQLHFLSFSHRRGKPGVLNDLAAAALALNPAEPRHVFLITDANVLLEPSTLKRLIRHYANPEVVLVDARMVNTGMQAQGISKSEERYISSEVLLKYREGQVWGKMIGPFGGCYTLRSDRFHPVPENYLVDDFFLAMKAFQQGGLALNDLEALCYEAVSHEINQEYRRKKRISTGNFQNLVTFFYLWFPPVRPLSFAFFSHKVLRWVGPFLMLGFWSGSAILAIQGNLLFQLMFLLQIAVYLIVPLLDIWLQKRNLHVVLFRNIRYFIWMNFALLNGFFNFLKGVKGGSWEPPKRV